MVEPPLITKFEPRLDIPIALVCCAFMLGRPAFGLFKSGLGRELWWLIAVLSVLSALFLFAAAHGLVIRRRARIDVSYDGIDAFGAHVPHVQVVWVARSVDTWFKGVRIDIFGGKSVYVPVHLHKPRRVLAAFKEHGYNVAVES